MSARGLAPSSVLAVILLALSGSASGDRGLAPVPRAFDPMRGSLPRDEPQAIYSPDPADAWNRLFHLLFTRTIRARLTADGAAMFAAGDNRLALSDRIVTRIESGDRAIDPLYPSWLWMSSDAFDLLPNGRFGTLDEPRYSQLRTALIEVRDSAATRPPLARALMQADLWAAYDMLYQARPHPRPQCPRCSRTEERAKRIDGLLPLLGAAIRALALTRAQIAALPDVYAEARRQPAPSDLRHLSGLHHRSGLRALSGQPDLSDLPDLFGPRSDWIELRWFPTRSHDAAVHDRRAARVFIKPTRRPADVDRFLQDLRKQPGVAPELDAAALFTQSLLIADDGAVIVSPLPFDVQIRQRIAGRASGTDRGTHNADVNVNVDADAATIRPSLFAPAIFVQEYELNRQRILSTPRAAGLARLAEDAPVYLPAAGNDFSFATPPRMEGEPVVVPLRNRCTLCHGSSGLYLSPFSMITAPDRPLPPVTRLQPSAQTHATDVATLKMMRDDFRSLMQLWSSRPARK